MSGEAAAAGNTDNLAMAGEATTFPNPADSDDESLLRTTIRTRIKTVLVNGLEDKVDLVTNFIAEKLVNKIED
eukprot:m.371693 g.371693  ORF g.371693 m.371693 type:complete len:73 (-) comp16684_c2_seq14:317-535(-)